MKKINIKKLYICLFLITCVGFATGCGNQPLFDELATNRVRVIIKGTYESNGTTDWDLSSFPGYLDSPAEFIYNVADANPTRFMLDIAGLRLYSGKYKQDFANYRKTYSAPIVSGPSNSDPTLFFNGEGVEYKNDDMRPGFVWLKVGIFIRKMLFDGAVDYSPSIVTTWGDPGEYQDLFREEKVEGYNFNLAQVLSYHDYLRTNYQDVNRIFPLKIPFEDGFVFDYDEEEVVMEIRFVIKNFVKKYEYEYVDSDGNHKLRHYFALSDWLRDVKKGEPTPTSDTMGIIGGNVLGVARYYVPGKTATISGTVALDSYVIAVKNGHSPDEYGITLSERTRPTCDAPKRPRLPILAGAGSTSAYIEDLLQYYLEYETYKDNYDTYISCVDSGEYETKWNEYNDDVSSYIIPPIVTYTASGAFELTNVPVGETYTIYQSTSGYTAGELPEYSSTPIGCITLTEDNAGSVPIPMGSCK